MFHTFGSIIFVDSNQYEYFYDGIQKGSFKNKNQRIIESIISFIKYILEKGGLFKVFCFWWKWNWVTVIIKTQSVHSLEYNILPQTTYNIQQ